MRPCSAVVTGMEAGKTEMSAQKKESVKQKMIKQSTIQPVDLGRLGVDGELSFSESPEAAGVGVEEFLENLAAFFDDNLSRRAR